MIAVPVAPLASDVAVKDLFALETHLELEGRALLSLAEIANPGLDRGWPCVKRLFDLHHEAKTLEAAVFVLPRSLRPVRAIAPN